MLPTLSNLSYGYHERQKLDLWLPQNLPGPFPFYLYLHGGGYAWGDKQPVDLTLLQGLLSRGVAVASANYRYTPDPEYLAPLKDGQTALQFLRLHASAFNLHKSRASVGGGSAGAATAFWIGFGPDRADPSSPDPVFRESTRISCIAAWEAQTSLDPFYLRSIIPGPTWTIDSISTLLRVPFDQYETPAARARFKDVACTDWVDRNSPPVFLFNATPNLPLNDQLEIGPGIHHPHIGVALKQLLDPLGVECVLRTREQFPANVSNEVMYPSFFNDLCEFVARHLDK